MLLLMNVMIASKNTDQSIPELMHQTFCFHFFFFFLVHLILAQLSAGVRADSTWIGNSPFSSQLCEQHAEGPDVRLDGETTVQSCLRRGPLDGELCS